MSGHTEKVFVGETNNGNILTLLRANVLAYILITFTVNIYVLMRNVQHVGPLWAYHIAVQTFFVLTIYYCNRKNIFQSPSGIELNQAHFFLLVSLIIFSSLTLTSYGDVPLWLDEYSQAWGGIGSIVENAAHHDQPPGGYILTSFLGNILGFGTLSIKLTGFIPSLLALYAFQLLLIDEKNFWLYSIFLTFFFLIDLDLRYLSLEGRSVAYGVMSLAFCALALRVFTESGAAGDWILFVLCGYLFLNSVGMQPVIIACSFGTGFLIFSLGSRHHIAKKTLKISLGILLAALIFAPIQLKIMYIANNADRFHASFHERFIHWTNSVTLGRCAEYLLSINVTPYWTSAIFILALFLFAKNARKLNRVHYSIGIALPLWVLIFEVAYHVLVQWPMMRRYFLCYYVLANVMAFITISKYLRSPLLKVLLLSTVVFMTTPAQTRKHHEARLSPWRLDWKSAYDKIREDHRSERIYVLGTTCNVHIDGWCDNFMIGLPLYYKKNGPLANDHHRLRQADFLNFEDNGMIYDLKKTPLSKINVTTLLPLEFHDLDEIYKKLEDSTSPHDYDIDVHKGFFIITTKKRVPISQSIPQLLELIANTLEEEPHSYYPYVLLVWYYYNQGNREKFKYWHDRFFSIPNIEEALSGHSSSRKLLANLRSLTI